MHEMSSYAKDSTASCTAMRQINILLQQSFNTHLGVDGALCEQLVHGGGGLDVEVANIHEGVILGELGDVLGGQRAVGHHHCKVVQQEFNTVKEVKNNNMCGTTLMIAAISQG